MPKEVSFDATPDERRAIERCAKRAAALGLDDFNFTHDNGVYVEIQMDLTAVHANGCPMDFKKLESFDDFNFMHDIVGIRDCLDRRSGKLLRNFSPRASRRGA
jgi:hypothetical protein